MAPPRPPARGPPLPEEAVILGPEAAAASLAARLADQLPTKLDELATRYEAEPATLPHPAVVAAHDRLRLPVEDWPAVLVLVQELSRITPVDRPQDGGETWVGRYPFRVYLWLRGDDDAGVDLLRKRYVLAVREVLMARRSLIDPTSDAAGTATPAGDVPVIDALALREDYGPVALSDAGATVAPAWVGADVLIAEEVPRLPDLGTANTITTDTTTLPHPAL